MSGLVVVLDIGTSTLRGICGCQEADGTYRIKGFVQIDSKGIRKGQVVKNELVSDNIEKLISQLSNQANASLKDAYCILNCGDTQYEFRSISELVEGGMVDAEDIARIQHKLGREPLPTGRLLIENVAAGYFLGDMTVEVENPEGSAADRLRACSLCIHLPKQSYDLFDDASLQGGVTLHNERLCFAPMCAATVSLTEEEKQSGAMVLDYGGGTISWCIYQNSHAIGVGSLPIGGDNITNDLLVAFNPGSTKKAEELKREYGTVDLRSVKQDQRVPIPVEVSRKARDASLNSIATIINARVDETLRIVKKQLEEKGLLNKFPIGIVLSGGASRLRGYPELVQQIFSVPTRMITILPSKKSNVKKIDTNPVENAAILGAFIHSARSEWEKLEESRRPWLIRIWEKLRTYMLEDPEEAK